MTDRPASFTIESAVGYLRSIVINSGISLPLREKNLKLDDPRILKVPALWDTGASMSSVTTTVAKMLNLRPISKTEILHFGGKKEVDVYLVNIYLPNQVVISGVPVCQCDDPVGADGKHTFGFILGMDIIAKGDFAISSQNGRSLVSFQYPSAASIDFTADMPYHSRVVKPKEQPRNALCACGSGKKYKSCHGQK